MILSAIATNINDTSLLNGSQSEVRKVLKKNQNSFQCNQSKISDINLFVELSKEYLQKLSSRKHFLGRFLKSIWFCMQKKMEQILQVYGLSKETFTAIMMLYKNLKAVVCSPNCDGKLKKKDPRMSNHLKAYGNWCI